MLHNKSFASDQLKELTNPDGPYAKLMFTGKNLRQFTKHSIDAEITLTAPVKGENKIENKMVNKMEKVFKPKDTIYKPNKSDSLFWCFYILKYGLSKYEMEVGNQHFTIEKQEKFKYIDEIRKTSNKDLLKTHKIKPLTLLEDDLANQPRISIKTFFALCVIENINIMLIDKRKVYEIIMTDDPKIHVVHRNSVSNEHHIELDVTADAIHVYRESYYKMPSFDTEVKSMTSYKVEELLELCKKLGIILENTDKKKLLKKDIYELLVQQY
jgi:hypothetical protein